jgi:hypothetical protein
VTESVPFPVAAGLNVATQLLFIDKDVPAAIARIEHEAAFVLYERSERQRIGLARLRDLGHGDLLDAYIALANRTAQLGSLAITDDSGQPLAKEMAALTAMTEEIRGIPGFESFLAYPTLPALFALDYPDPVAYIVSIEAGGYAILIEPGAEQRISTIPLLSLKSGEAYAHAIHAWYAYRQAEETDAAQTIEDVAKWCWDVCMGPLCGQLANYSRVTLVPVGVTQLLPLHVAWTETPTRRVHVIDNLAVSIAPNLRLAAANRSPATAAGSNVAAFAPQASHDTDIAPRLPWSAHEVAAIARGAESRTFLDGQATQQAFLDAIGKYGRIHLAGHALASISVPWASQLMFFEGPATIVALADAASSRTSLLGVLSCCTGALGSALRPASGATIAGVLLATSFRCLVASMWRVRDDYGAILMSRFHSLLGPEAANTAEALREAQLWFRDAPIDEIRTFAQSKGISAKWVDETRTSVAAWGAFFHSGPSS